MKLTLKDFQEEAVARLTRQMRNAGAEVKDIHQACLLESPTGSGKTIMMTAAMERIVHGDETNPPDEDAVFLWLSDQPQLNEQTRRKILDASDVFTDSHLIPINASFDADSLTPGNVYFLNIQRIRKDALLVEGGDKRTYTIWETLANTITERPAHFFLVIDEAHRGMGQTDADERAASTIVQRFIKGSPEMPAVPLITGISATPERFKRLLEGSSRTIRPITIKPEDVRLSGLLKDAIRLYHPKESDPSELTLLKVAAHQLRDFSSRWRSYCTDQGEPVVEPILVVQVEDATASDISATPVAKAMEIILGTLGPLQPEAFAHSFQEGTSVMVEGRSLRYIAPPDIEADPQVRVVFFKTSLNTGWDCPRAEVMMSFRAAKDHTAIAQLVGRMVRTPLARRVEKDAFLNTVALFLPRYDQKGLAAVIDYLTTPKEGLPPVGVEMGAEMVFLTRASKLDEIIATLEKIPRRIVPSRRRMPGVKRLMRLARLLANDELRPDAVREATAHLLKVLLDAFAKQSPNPEFSALVNATGQVRIRRVDWATSGAVTADEDILVDLALENVNDRFEAVGRRLGEGLHKAWLKNRAGAPSAVLHAKRELIALALDQRLLDEVERQAQKQTREWLQEHRGGYLALGESHRQEYEDVMERASTVEEGSITYPHTILAKKSVIRWEKHLFTDDDGLFPFDGTSWEKAVLKEELRKSDIAAWLRNPSRQKWSFSIDYEYGGDQKPTFPDFLFVRREGHRYVIDVLDPHLLKYDDAPARARGIAKFVAENLTLPWGRFELIKVDGEKVHRLDLMQEPVRRAVASVTAHDLLNHLFDNPPS